MDGSKSSSEEVKNVDVYTAKGLLSTGYRYLDVRTKTEFQKGHVEGAVNIPYMFVTEEGRVKNQDFIAQVLEVSQKDDKLVVACNRGGRGLKATIDLKNEGYEHVANIEGGYSAWVDAGFAGENAEKTACKFHP
ncbi:protein HIGH ARSENIC CONTENT 1, mitochondrial-like [Amaranthus tricolor]|uniref:protein HIGH ARSENIC CONTENT 1, mitochondrial-like n=1 Tax=Amaranthus tricolor TaxID=29722 RepID=UPI002584025E|nr:protein HIGH ARSENIC CONTENT 1, mitochondrial-like [Amaranthus tricolor]